MTDAGSRPEPRAARAGRSAPRALWYEAAGECVLNAEPLRAPGPGEVAVRALWSGISRGTERLVWEGRVPEGERARMRAPLQEGAFPFPVKYGYSLVGTVEDGPADWAGRTVFALAPHAERVIAPLSLVSAVPEGVPPRRAVLAANMETALNAVWDSGVGPGDRVVVVGAGVVGLLAAGLCARLPGAEVTAVDVAVERDAIARALGVRFAAPGDAPLEADVVFHASATAAGLATALRCAGLEARVVELSWYGETPVAAPLGGAFHPNRLTLVSSQVGHVSPSRRPRWSHARRLAKALELLRDPAFDALVTHEIAFDDLPRDLPALLAPGAPGLTAAVRYRGDAPSAAGDDAARAP